VLLNRDSVDKGETSWTGPTRMSTESLPSKALSMTSGSVLSPVGDGDPMDRSISQPNIAGGLKLPTNVPPSPTVLASGSSTSSDLSRGGYASADSLGSMSSKEDMLSTPSAGAEMQSPGTERATRDASPCRENVPSLSLAVDEQSVRSSSFSTCLEPTPDLVLHLPLVASENTAKSCVVSPTLTSAEMFASAEHGTIKKSGTPGRSSASGEEGTGVDEVFPHTPSEITQALECDSFSFDLLPSPPAALADIPDATMQPTDEAFELPPWDSTSDLSLRCESLSCDTSSEFPPIPNNSSTQSCSINSELSDAVSESQMLSTSASPDDMPQVSSDLSANVDDGLPELKLSDCHLPSVPQASSVEVHCKSAELESVGMFELPISVALDKVHADVTRSQASSSADVVAPIDLHAVLSSDHVRQEGVTAEHVSDVVQLATVPPVDVSLFQNVAVAPDVVTSSDSTAITFSSAAKRKSVPTLSRRPCSSPTYAEQSSAVPQLPEDVPICRSTTERRASESAVTSPTGSYRLSVTAQSDISHAVPSAHHEQAASVAFAEPLPHRPPPSLAAHSAALQLLTQKPDSSGAAEKPEASPKLDTPEKPKSKPPPPVKKKPVVPLKEKFFPTHGDHHQQ